LARPARAPSVIEITFGCILAAGRRGVKDAAPASA